MKAVLARHDELLRRAIEDHGGYVVSMTGLCELAAVRGTEGVLEAVADVFDVTACSGQTLEQALVEFLRHKELLLVLDNCEHVLDEAAELVEALGQRSCPRVVVLATSREGMGIDGERILAVPSLGCAERLRVPIRRDPGCGRGEALRRSRGRPGPELEINADNVGVGRPGSVAECVLGAPGDDAHRGRVSHPSEGRR